MNVHVLEIWTLNAVSKNHGYTMFIVSYMLYQNKNGWISSWTGQ